MLLQPQASFSGTPRFSGDFTQPDEYADKLRDPNTRMDAFEEMRRSEESVNAAITSRVSLGLASSWFLSSPSDDPKATEILEFCEDNIYPLLDDFLRKAYEAVHYGFSAQEPVYAWNDRPFARAVSRGKVQRPTKSGSDRRIYLQKFAHIRQRTVYTFRVGERGELNFVEQWVYTGSTYARVPIPAAKLCIWTYDKTGDDFWGVPPTRYAYKAYTFKRQLENLNLLGFDRFGVGTPVAEGGESWTAAEYKTLETYLKAWRAGSNTYLVHPNGGKVQILSGQGSLYLSVLDWVKYYGIGIAMQWLTQGSHLSLNSDAGARSLGDTMYEEAGNAVQSDGEQLAAIINEQILVPLVDSNFGPQKEYPLFNPSQRVRASSTIGTILQSFVSSGFLHPSPQDEAYIRDAMKLPAIAIKDLQAAADARAAMVPQPPADPNAAPGSGTTEDKSAGATGQAPPRAKAATPAVPPPRVAASRVALTAVTEPPDPAAPGVSYRTPEWSTVEAAILKPDILIRDLNIAEQQLAGEVQQVLGRVDLFLTHRVEAIAAEGQQYLSDNLHQLTVPTELRTEMQAALKVAADRMRAYGATSVANEVARQIQPDQAGPTRERPSMGALPSSAYPPPSVWSQVKAWALALVSPSSTTANDTESNDTDADRNARDLAIAAEITAVVFAEMARREQAARTAALDALAQAPAAVASELAALAAARAQGALEELSTYRTQDEVGSVISTSFGAGRADGIDTVRVTYVDQLKALVYSAVMDGGTCVECAQWDGAEFPPDYDQTPSGAVKAPNPNCAGSRTRCRCVWVAILSDETDPIVGPSKGPLAATADKAGGARDEPRGTARRGRVRDIHIHEAAAPAPAPNVTVNHASAAPAPPQNIALTMPPISITIQMPGREPVTKEIQMEIGGKQVHGTVTES